jgi:hypothetical protein
LFENHKNVTIKHLNFYDLDSAYPEKEFDTIIFGSSFMLMPDQVKAIELAKSKVLKIIQIIFLKLEGYTSF